MEHPIIDIMVYANAILGCFIFLNFTTTV